MARPLVCAHRGVSAHCPENTLVAIEEAVKIGAPMTEIDVRRTADGHIVLMHDETIDRTTNGCGAVADLTLEDICCLDAGSWKGEQFVGETVPTLADVLDVCQNGRMFLCIEIKQYPIAPDVAALIEGCGMVDNTVVISFDFDCVCQVRQANPRIATGWLTAKIDPADLDDMLGRVLAEGIPVISALHTQVTPEVVDRCRLRGITLYAWTIDDEAEARRLAEMGVDVIASNRPGEIMAAL
jgi:glycerophosphoryl diester phosphodiesterase